MLKRPHYCQLQPALWLICRSCYECETKGKVWKPKTKRSARSIPIVPEIRQLLQDFFSKHVSVMTVISNRIAAYKILRSLGERTGLDHRLFPHALRGTFATILAAKDFNRDEIQEALGWTSSRTAEDYIRISAARLTKAFKTKW